jgi:hypothetical protein
MLRYGTYYSGDERYTIQEQNLKNVFFSESNKSMLRQIPSVANNITRFADTMEKVFRSMINKSTKPTIEELNASVVNSMQVAENSRQQSQLHYLDRIDRRTSGVTSELRPTPIHKETLQATDLFLRKF